MRLELLKVDTAVASCTILLEAMACKSQNATKDRNGCEY